jgi:hypothetical protein
MGVRLKSNPFSLRHFRDFFRWLNVPHTVRLFLISCQKIRIRIIIEDKEEKALFTSSCDNSVQQWQTFWRDSCINDKSAVRKFPKTPVPKTDRLLFRAQFQVLKYIFYKITGRVLCSLFVYHTCFTHNSFKKGEQVWGNRKLYSLEAKYR